MARSSLAALYRPQTFAQLVGQDLVKTILSRAAFEERVAPAYLLSGTRGVGKTTVARIFAKALNCAQAPTAEPCNVCDACRRITMGSFVDVVEIDGASNRGIDDIRRLRDAVGYAPLEGRYKVFIIDEAHMLTKEAFNALLKTLEEPPPKVVFILATTEQHKFPVTILSRCQHFVFKQLPEVQLEAHVAGILQKEGLAFEPEAVKLIAHRAAGSVRDAMSLLGQALALNASTCLTVAQTRNVLGLAGREAIDQLLRAIIQQDAATIANLVRELLAMGVDMGFFLRELASLWRNLFIFRQSNGQLVQGELNETEIARFRTIAAGLSLSYIHAAWQMTLDGQRRILTSLEPAAGLELLLLNLAMLPRLLPIRELSHTAISHTEAEEPVLPAAEKKMAEPGNTRLAEPGPPEAYLQTAPVQAFAAESAVEPEPAEPQAQDSDPTDQAQWSETRLGSFDEEEEFVADPDRTVASPPRKTLVWEEFIDFAATQSNLALPGLRQFKGEFADDRLTLTCNSQVLLKQIQNRLSRDSLAKALQEWAGCQMEIVFKFSGNPVKSEFQLRNEMEEHPIVQALKQHYDAYVLRCSSLDKPED